MCGSFEFRKLKEQKGYEKGKKLFATKSQMGNHPP